jgi:hypothetical protein
MQTETIDLSKFEARLAAMSADERKALFADVEATQAEHKRRSDEIKRQAQEYREQREAELKATATHHNRMLCRTIEAMSDEVRASWMLDCERPVRAVESTRG